MINPKLKNSIEECNTHKKRLFFASQKIKHFIPLNKESFLNLKDDDISYFDQFIYRFSKLQDTMGNNLFYNFLDVLKEEPKNLPFIDILNKLEKFGILKSTFWIELRKLRNLIAHEYSKIIEENIEATNKIYNNLDKIFEILEKIEKEAQKYM